jgi:hypothetical protein
MEGGFQVSPEGFDMGLQLGFIVTFASFEDLEYFLKEDPEPALFRAFNGPHLDTSLPKFIFDFVV